MLLDAPFFVNSGERSAGLDTGHLDIFPMKVSKCPKVHPHISRTLARERPLHHPLGDKGGMSSRRWGVDNG